MKLKRVIVKEVKELLKEKTVLFGMILGPIIIFAIFAGMSTAAGRQAIEQAAYVRDIAILYDGTEYQSLAVTLAKSLNVSLYSGVDVRDALARHSAVVVLDDSFFKNITMGIRGRAEVVVKVDSLSFISVSLPEQIESMLRYGVYAIISDMIAYEIPRASPGFFQSPVASKAMLYYKGRLMSTTEAFALIFGVGLSVTMATMILVMSSMQVAATSIGIERESKTLEMLLSLPVSRRTLILGKIAGVALITMMGIISYGVGVGIYFYSFSTIIEAGPEAQTGGGQIFSGGMLDVSLGEVVLLVIGLAITLFISLLIGFMAGSMAHDVRGAQLASSYLGLVLLAPVFAVFFGVDISNLEGAWRIIYLDPIVLLYLVAWGIVTSDAGMYSMGFAGLAISMLFWLFLAGRVIDSEAILIGGRYRRLTRMAARLLARSSS